MQTEEPIHAPKQSSPSQFQQPEHPSNEKAHGKIYMAAQNMKNKLKDKMHKSFGSFEFDDKDDSALIIALISSSS